jgi:TonB family protein
MTHSRLICAASLMALVTAQLAGPATAGAIRPTIPGVKDSIIDCEVTADQMTANCGYRPSIYWKPGPRDLAVIDDVNAHPVHLADATPGAKVEVIVRRVLGKRTDDTRPAEPADWAPPPPTDVPPLIVDPNWRVLPSANDLKLFYPDRAYRLGINGDATATCSIGPAGDLVRCWLSSESPTDQGFDFALLKMTTCLQVEPVTKSGLPSPGRTIKVGAHFTVGRRAFAVQLVVLAA